MSLKNAIGLSFVLIAVYAIFIFGNNVQLALLMGSVLPIYLIWMVIKTLKHPYKSKYTFKERFYEDYDYFRSSEN